MAYQVLGRSIQSTYLFISHVNALFRPLPPLLSVSTLTNCSSKKQQCSSAFGSLLFTSTFQRSAALSQHKTQSFLNQEEEENYEDEGRDYENGKRDYEEEEDDEEFNDESKVVVSSGEQKQVTNPARRIPELTVKEKKELSAYAHSLGKKLKCHQSHYRFGVQVGVDPRPIPSLSPSFNTLVTAYCWLYFWQITEIMRRGVL